MGGWEDNLLWMEKCKEAGLADCRESFRYTVRLECGNVELPVDRGTSVFFAGFTIFSVSDWDPDLVVFWIQDPDPGA